MVCSVDHIDVINDSLPVSLSSALATSAMTAKSVNDRSFATDSGIAESRPGLSWIRPRRQTQRQRGRQRSNIQFQPVVVLNPHWLGFFGHVSRLASKEASLTEAFSPKNFGSRDDGLDCRVLDNVGAGAGAGAGVSLARLISRLQSCCSFI